jgi:flagellin-like hook-associated protein FlgL
MRISQPLMSNLVRQSTERATRELLAANKPIADQASIASPSEDPVKASRIASLDRVMNEQDRLSLTRGMVLNDMKNAESTIESLHDVIVSAKSLAVQMGSDTIDPDTRRTAAAEARRLFEQAVAFANRADATGKHQFAGLAENAPPLTSTGVYQGNDGQRFVEVGPGISVEATLRGSDVFGPSNEVMNSLSNLVTALESGESASVRATLDELETGRVTLSHARTDVGARIATLQDMEDLSFSLKVSAESERDSLLGVDIAAVAPRIQVAQTMLAAVIQTSQQIMAQIGRGFFG